MNKQTYHCSRCGSFDVREIRWIDPNNGEILSIFEGLEGLSDYCNTCDDTTRILLKTAIVESNRNAIYEWQESKEHLQCKHSATLTGDDTIIVPACVCKLGLTNEGGESCEFYEEIKEAKNEYKEMLLPNSVNIYFKPWEKEEPNKEEREVKFFCEEERRDPTKILSDLFTYWGKTFSPEVFKHVPDRCESCSEINTVGSVVTCDVILRERGKFVPIPDVTKIPLWCPKNNKLTDEECKVLWNDMFPNNPIK